VLVDEIVSHFDYFMFSKPTLCNLQTDELGQETLKGNGKKLGEAHPIH
jgi:hypothetical protein